MSDSKPHWCLPSGINSLIKIDPNLSTPAFPSFMQEFVELVRKEELAAAIKYARANLSQWAGPFEEEHQRAFAVLVFTADTQCGRYQVRWPSLHFCRGFAASSSKGIASLAIAVLQAAA